MLGAYGRSAVWAETSDGKLRLLPLAWTSLYPRPEPLTLDGRAVRLEPEALRALSAWVSARLECKKLDSTDREDQKPRDGVGDRAGARAAVAAVVGQARSPDSQRRGHPKRGTR